MGQTSLAQLFQKHQQQILEDWIRQQLGAATLRSDLLKENELREQSREFLKNFIDAAQAGTEDVNAPSWKPAKEVLSSISRSRAAQGFSPSETAMFVFSLKQPLFEVLKRESLPAQELADGSWRTTVLLDKLGLYTMEVFQQSREAIIGRQQEELLELSTPVVQLVGQHPGPAADRHARQRADSGGDGKPARKNRRNRSADRDHRYHRCARRWTPWSLNIF